MMNVEEHRKKRPLTGRLMVLQTKNMGYPKQHSFN
jgi:hypothetical protein